MPLYQPSQLYKPSCESVAQCNLVICGINGNISLISNRLNMSQIKWRISAGRHGVSIRKLAASSSSAIVMARRRHLNGNISVAKHGVAAWQLACKAEGVSLISARRSGNGAESESSESGNEEKRRNVGGIEGEGGSKK